jgi:hypothetical protein
MEKCLGLTLAVFLWVAVSVAQVASEPGTPAPPRDPATKVQIQNSDAAFALASGTVLSTELSKPLDARKSKANDKIEAKIAVDLLAHGQIVIPRNTKIIGHVTQAKARSKVSPDSLVGITFDRMLMKDGRQVPLQAAVQAIARPLQLAPSMGNVPSADNSSSTTSISPARRPTMGSSSSSPSITPNYPSSDPENAPDPQGSNSSTVSPLTPSSHGVVGIRALTLETSGAVSLLSSSTENIHLDSGTQLILRVE